MHVESWHAFDTLARGHVGSWTTLESMALMARDLENSNKAIETVFILISVHLFIYLYISLFIIDLFIYLFVRLFVFDYLFVCLFVFLFVCIFIYYCKNTN